MEQPNKLWKDLWIRPIAAVAGSYGLQFGFLTHKHDALGALPTPCCKEFTRKIVELPTTISGSPLDKLEPIVPHVLSSFALPSILSIQSIASIIFIITCIVISLLTLLSKSDLQNKLVTRPNWSLFTWILSLLCQICLHLHQIQRQLCQLLHRNKSIGSHRPLHHRNQHSFHRKISYQTQPSFSLEMSYGPAEISPITPAPPSPTLTLKDSMSRDTQLSVAYLRHKTNNTTTESSTVQCGRKCWNHRKLQARPLNVSSAWPSVPTSTVFSILCLLPLLLQSITGPLGLGSWWLVEAVTVTEVHIMSIHSGRTDYVVQGESVQLSCHYVFSKQYERVVAVNWKKDGQEVYFSTPNKRPIALSIFRGHVDYNSRDLLNTVTLFDVDLNFAGQYSCRVITELNESENTASMTVIVDACKDSDWKTKTDMVNCVEEISFHCVGMYPKPSPACSIHNDDTDQYFAGETFDMIERLPNRTYEIAIQRRYHAANFSQYAGRLSFHCHLLVLMTSWRMGIKYKLFGESGCVKPPPEINNGTSLIIGDQTCWGTPKENSRVNYTCHDGFQLMGPSVLICRNGTWIPDPISLMSQPVSDVRTYATLKLPMPYCHIRGTSSARILKKPASTVYLPMLLLLCCQLLLRSLTL